MENERQNEIGKVNQVVAASIEEQERLFYRFSLQFNMSMGGFFLSSLGEPSLSTNKFLVSDLFTHLSLPLFFINFLLGLPFQHFQISSASEVKYKHKMARIVFQEYDLNPCVVCFRTCTLFFNPLENVGAKGTILD